MMQRAMLGCPYPIGEDKAKELGGVYTPPARTTWPTFTFRFPKGEPAWTSEGCPWPEFVESNDLAAWVNAWELLHRFGKTPVDIGLWPKVTTRYLEVMLHLDRLSEAAEQEHAEREQEKLKRQYPQMR
jgi:hypothetical protein